MKAENTTKIQFDSLSVNEAYARGAAAAFLARYDPTVPQLADLKTAVSEAVKAQGLEHWTIGQVVTAEGAERVHIG